MYQVIELVTCLIASCSYCTYVLHRALTHYLLLSSWLVFLLTHYGVSLCFARTCTNNSSWIEKLLSLETVPDSIYEDLRVVFEMEDVTQISPIHSQLDFLLGNKNKLLRNNNVMKFLRNAILLLLNVFPRNHVLEEALLAAEELFMAKTSSSTCSVNPSRALAKCLLKNDRQVL